MKNVLITGASGFIGSFLTEEAVRRGYQVYAGIRKDRKTKYRPDENIRIFAMNLADKAQLIRDLQNYARKGVCFHYIIYNAGVTKSINKKDFLTVNCHYTMNLVEALKESNCTPEKFLYISSLEAFGPGDESSLQPVSETDIPRPFSRYGQSKLKAEQYLMSLDHFPYLIIRPTGVYGPRERDYYVYIKAINRGFEFYIGRKKQFLSFIYVKDLVRLIFLSLESGLVREAYFATDGKDYTSEDFAKVVKEILGKKCLKIVIPKSMVRWISMVAEPASHLLHKQTMLNSDKVQALTCTNWLCDSGKIRKALGFDAEYDLKKGMAETIAWYKSNHWL